MKEGKILYADDATEGVGLLLRLRLPWLFVGLVGGVISSFLVSRFETVLSENIALAFFLPFIVYMSDAVGSQTEAIFVRSLAKRATSFVAFVLKEFLLGIVLGLIFGGIVGSIAYLWLGSIAIAFTVGLAMSATVGVAPLVALLIPEFLFEERADPAVGAGPFTTIIQDLLSILIYFTVASLILFR